MNKIPFPLLLPTVLLLGWAIPAAAEPPVQALEPVQAVEPVQTVRLVFDCDARTLPSQRLVGETLGQHNFSQVYASRTRLMAEVGRVCQRPDAERVGLVLTSDPTRAKATDRRVAHQAPPSRYAPAPEAASSSRRRNRHARVQ